MYSMVLMAAMLPSGDTAAFGKKNGCDGGCTGTVSAKCSGGGFLGLKDKSGCCGGGFLGLKDKAGCHGGFLGHKAKSSGCTGAPACDNCGAAVPPPAVAMPKEEPKPMPKPEPKPEPKPKSKGD